MIKPSGKAELSEHEEFLDVLERILMTDPKEFKQRVEETRQKVREAESATREVEQSIERGARRSTHRFRL